MKVRTLLALVAVGVAGWLVLRDDAPAPPAEAPAASATSTARQPLPARPSDPDDARERIAALMRLRLERALEAPEEAPLPETIQSRIEAEAAFEATMQMLEAQAEKDDLAPRRRRARLYRYANDAFSAMSLYLDPTSARDQATLEESYARMKTMLSAAGAEPDAR